jgi:GxxExxY protein
MCSLCSLCGSKKQTMKITKSYINNLIYQVNGAAIEVHKALGPGLLESVYHKCLKQELSLRGIDFISEMLVPVSYKGLEIEVELRCDLFIENILVVELKAVEAIHPIHEAQLLTYMKLLKSPKGLLINFNVTNIFKEGQKTFVNELYRNLPN